MNESVEEASRRSSLTNEDRPQVRERGARTLLLVAFADGHGIDRSPSSRRRSLRSSSHPVRARPRAVQPPPWRACGLFDWAVSNELLEGSPSKWLGAGRRLGASRSSSGSKRAPPLLDVGARCRTTRGPAARPTYRSIFALSYGSDYAPGSLWAAPRRRRRRCQLLVVPAASWKEPARPTRTAHRCTRRRAGRRRRAAGASPDAPRSVSTGPAGPPRHGEPNVPPPCPGARLVVPTGRATDAAQPGHSFASAACCVGIARDSIREPAPSAVDLHGPRRPVSTAVYLRSPSAVRRGQPALRAFAQAALLQGDHE